MVDNVVLVILESLIDRTTIAVKVFAALAATSDRRKPYGSCLLRFVEAKTADSNDALSLKKIPFYAFGKLFLFDRAETMASQLRTAVSRVTC